MSTKETISSRRNVLHELKSGYLVIKDNYKYIKSLAKQGEEVLGSGEWLLDNIYLIEKEYKAIKVNMPYDYFNNLPALKHLDIQGVPRILIYAKEYIKQKEGNVNQDDAIDFIERKDERFTMGELWAFPLMLRIAIILKLSKITTKLVNIQKQKINGKMLAFKIIDAESKNSIDDVLIDIDNSYDNMSGIFLEELLKVLRDNSIEDKKIYSLIEKKSRNEDSSSELIKNNFLEASIEQTIGSCVNSLREVDGINWRDFFTKTSEIEKILKQDPHGSYELMDFESKDHYRHQIEKLSNKIQVDEITLTEKILYLARRANEGGKRDYRTHVGYYILDYGVKELAESFNIGAKVKNRFSEGLFVLINILGTLGIVALVLFIMNLFDVYFTNSQYIIATLLMIIPASEIVVALLNWSVANLTHIRFVPKLDFSKGVPNNKKTVIVIPAILPSAKRTVELMEQLEVSYLANRDTNFYFALLGDFKDSNTAKCDEDDEIIEAGLKKAVELNKKYFNDDNHFFFLCRERIYNQKEKVYIGRERKRGKLMEFMSLLRDEENHTFNIISSYIGPVKDVKYLITLDADTYMTRDSAYRLVGAMSHVLNKAFIKKNRVVHGYGIMQPKVSITIESKNKTTFSKVFAGQGGIDGYSIAYSDVYEDLFGEGSFTGKGIIDIDTFYDVLKDEIPENTVLSHDLLEGAYARCALVTDVEFIDNYPASYEASCRRLHRWVRGDWQLLRWLFSKKISLLSKWKIFDNLRRSLLAPVLLIAVLLNLTVLNGSSQIALLCFLGAIVPLVFTVTDFVVTPKNKLIGTWKSLQQIILIISFIPYQAYLMIDAILRTLFRVFISKKNLLQWQTAEDAEITTNNSARAYTKRMWFPEVCGMIIILLALGKEPAVAIVNLSLAVLWILSPYIAFYISLLEDNEEEFKLDEEDKKYLRDNSRRIWAYYEDFVNEENNYLAPDNYQEKPYKGIAYRTSPTNIGMGLTSNLVAYDLGYIGVGEVVDRLELILGGMSKLEKYNGHYLNWYDTRTCTPLWPKYISTVDSGNLLGYLWIISHTIVEYCNNPLIRRDEILSLKDTIKILELEEFIDIDRYDLGNIKDYAPLLEEILDKLNSMEILDEEKEKLYWMNKLKKEIKIKISYYDYFLGGLEKLLSDKFKSEAPSLKELKEYLDELKESSGSDFQKVLEDRITSVDTFIDRIKKIESELKNIIDEMDFKFLYNAERGLFAIGYNLEENSLGNSYYDLLASESRATSFIAIARNQVPKEHWFNLSRAMTNAFKGKSLVSWSGTMFEYFMPPLIMKSYKDTLLDMTYSSVINAQKEFAKQKHVPWGISESAYYQFDVADNYQYKAFGIPGIGLKED